MKAITQNAIGSLRDKAWARWTALGLLAFAMFCSYIFMDSLSPIKDLLQSTRGWDSTAFGTMQGSETFLNVFIFFLIFAGIILDKTPFYAEMGGQIGDKGVLICGDDTVEVIDTKRENNLPVHIVKRLPKDVTEPVHALINKEARQAICCNHSATHLLHEALREVLGTHVEQKGSYVSDDVLRFDFSQFQTMTPEEIRKVEAIANRNVRAAIERCEYRNMPIAEAKALGAMALFGEKYGDEVRVIKYGSSVELCGGTHVKNTGNIGMIKIISESIIASGIRRIEAITGARVEKTMY